ncbi:TPR repeat domain-containing protein [Naegleria gruberi]|uniref:TPR repeat domain-containing protein n=1 Tax=Naegleria gruberi TaxID=5762 RepID=D2VZM8_NAEGR|nr:TPR repeat domain-containing protein [Naegleria gruberi]EFC37724.1 TPR repeat domain-containing protein [Naegleria gruberi]|eukprot:XP_002670468.1 TPR repeat domain-containing protein [Naegleria gruberi strain NEG-M]
MVIGVKAHLSRGLAYSNLSKHQEAIQDFEQVDSLTEKYISQLEDLSDKLPVLLTQVKSWYLKGVSERSLKNHENSLKSLDKAIKLGKEYNKLVTESNQKHPIHNYYMTRGLIFNDQKNYEKSTKNFRKFIKLCPEEGNNNMELFIANHNLGIGLEKLDKEDEAFEAYSEAISHFGKVSDKEKQWKAHSGSLDTYYYRGLLSEKKESSMKCIADYDFVLRYNPNHLHAHQHRAAVLYHLKEYEQAIESFTKVIEHDPKDFTALFNRGMCYKFVGELAKSVIDFNQTTKVNPEFFKAYSELVRVLIKLDEKDPQRLIPLYTKSIELIEAGKVNKDDIPNDQSIGAIYFERGVQLVKDEKYQEAIDDFTSAIKKDGKFVDAYFNRANVYRRFLKKPEKALSDAEKVCELDETDVDGMMEVAMCLYDLDKVEDAKKQFERVLKTKPDHEPARRYLDYLNDDTEE